MTIFRRLDRTATVHAEIQLDRLVVERFETLPRRRSPGMLGLSRTPELVRSWRYAVRRGALLLVVTCQLSLVPGLAATGALADGASPGGSTETAPETPAPPLEGPSEGELGAIEPTPPSEPPTPPTPPPTEGTPPNSPPEERREAPGEPPQQAPPAPPSGSANEQPVVEERVASVPAPATTTTPSTPSAAAVEPVGRSSANAAPTAPTEGTGTAYRVARARQRHHPRVHRASSSPPAESVGSTSAQAGLSEVPADLLALGNGLPGGFEEAPPSFLVPIYKQAAHRFHVPWRVLAAINQIETDYGRNLSVSSAGAVGWMQFMPATWRRWGIDADHDGHANPYSPVDAIFTAARYLQASGAAHDLPGAVFSYNHADWYVAEVLLRAHALGSRAVFARVEQGYALPLDARFMHALGRTDDGVDIETAPDGALVYSITSGVVTAVASDPAGFGPDYPVVQATSGALAGRYVYYGHVARALVTAGQHVAAGQPIAIVGHAGDAASLGHGHIEIGLSDASGDPLSHHGTEAATPAGAVMRGVLVGLSAQFGIDNA
jgi:murein DD-endopeptidase MepM/ murein hydrolase activator NlpD/outer membrane biosynthesis protein TonB